MLLSSLCTLTACSLIHHHTYTDKNSGPEIKRVWQPKSFSSLKVNTYLEDIEVHAGKKYKVVYYGHKKLLPHVGVNDETLSIKSKQTLFSDFDINDDQTVAVYLPKKSLQDLTLHSADGDINLYGFIKAKSSSLNSDGGDITVDHLVTEQGNARSEDGDVTYDGEDYDNDDGGSYRSNLNSHNVLSVHSEDGDVTVN